MKILIATGIYPPDIGGPATYSKLLKDELPKHGIDVRVLSFGEVRHLPKIIRHLAYFFRVLKIGKSVDVIYAQDPVSVGLPATLAAKILRKRFILKVVGDYAWEQYSQKKGIKFSTPEDFQKMKVDMVSCLRRKIERFVGRRANKVIVPSKYLKKIVAMWGIKEGKIEVIYNAVSLKDAVESKEELRKRFEFKEQIIFSVGRLVPWKGFELLIEAMKDFPDVKLLIAGDGPDKKKLEEKIKDLSLGDRVKLIGRLEQDDLLKKIKASDLFVLNTGYEGLSHQLLEVMTVGTPIITTNVGGNPEVIEHGKDGILVEYNNKDELKKAIKNILKDGKGDNLTENAKEKLSLFEKERMLKEVVSILKNGANVLMISTDRKIFESKSGVRARIAQYGALAEELHIVVFSKKIQGFKKQKISDNVWVYPTGSASKLTYIFNAIKIGKKIVSGAGDWLVTTQDPFETGLVGWRVARGGAFGAPANSSLQLQIHTDFLSPHFTRSGVLNKIRVAVAKFLLPKADCVRVVSKRIADSIKSAGIKTKNPPEILPIFINTEAIKNTHKGTDLHTKYHQFETIILMVSRLEKEKNIPLALSAFEQVVKKHPKTGLVIIGDGRAQEMLKLQILNNNLQDNVILEGESSDVLSFYKSADIFLHTSNYEGYGLVLIEAALSGCPVVTTDVGVASEVFKDNENAYICNVLDQACLTQKITKLLQDKSLRNTFMTKAKDAADDFVKEKTKEQYLLQYKQSWGKCSKNTQRKDKED